MAASVLAHTHFNYDGSQRAGFPSGQWQPASWLPLPVVSQSLCVAIDTHDLRRGLRAQPANRTLACISRTRHARSPQRVARTAGKSHSRLHFAHSTRTISAEGCARSRQIALSPAFRALDTHGLRRGLHFRLTLFVPHSAFKREFIKWGNVFSLGHLPC